MFNKPSSSSSGLCWACLFQLASHCMCGWVEGYGPFTESLELIQNVPLEDSHNPSCTGTGTKCCLEFVRGDESFIVFQKVTQQTTPMSGLLWAVPANKTKLQTCNWARCAPTAAHLSSHCATIHTVVLCSKRVVAGRQQTCQEVNVSNSTCVQLHKTRVDFLATHDPRRQVDFGTQSQKCHMYFLQACVWSASPRSPLVRTTDEALLSVPIGPTIITMPLGNTALC